MYILNKTCTDLYTESQKTLKKEIKDPKKWGDILSSWTRRLNIVKILPKLI